MKFVIPARFTSSQVTAEFYRRARPELEIYLDYMTKTRTGRKCRLDAVVVIKDEIVAIVICKSSPNAARKSTQQKARYAMFGVPLVIVRGMDRVPEAVLEAKRIALSHGAQISDEDLASIGLGDQLE